MLWPDFAGVVPNEFIYEEENDWMPVGWRVIQ